MDAHETKPGRSSSVQSILAILLWLGAIHFNIIFVVVSLFFLPALWTFTVLGLFIILMVIPLYDDTQLAQGVAKFICKHAPSHFPITLVAEDMNAFDPDQAYIIAVEPHSILPIGIVALCSHTGYMPFTKMKALASSAIFVTPVLRHIWSWLGLVPASMKLLQKLLEDGYTCILIPGGIREVLFMEHDREVVYLKKRHGFIRAAFQTGSPLVPSFIFGQTHAYRWWKPKGKVYEYLSRAICFTPLAYWGIMGSPVPYQRPMYVAVGIPIKVDKNPEPSREQVDAVHAKYTTSLQELFEKHKVAAGYTETCLYIY